MDFANLPAKLDDAVDVTKDNSPGIFLKFRIHYMGGLKYNVHQAMLQIFAMYGAVVQGGGSVQSDE